MSRHTFVGITAPYFCAKCGETDPAKFYDRKGAPKNRCVECRRADQRAIMRSTRERDARVRSRLPQCGGADDAVGCGLFHTSAASSLANPDGLCLLCQRDVVRGANMRPEVAA